MIYPHSHSDVSSMNHIINLLLYVLVSSFSLSYHSTAGLKVREGEGGREPRDLPLGVWNNYREFAGLPRIF